MMLNTISRIISTNITRNIRRTTPSTINVLYSMNNQCIQNHLYISTSSNVLAKKRKKFKQQKRPELVEVDDDEDDDIDDDVDEKTALKAKGILHTGVGEAEEIVDDGLPKDYKRRNLKLASRRLDTLLNRTSGRSSSEVEKMILTGRVRVNEQIVKKKAYNIMKRDELDLWLEPIEENPTLAYVQRIKIVDYVLKQHGYDIDVMVWSKMIVENYRHEKEAEGLDV